MQLVGSIVQIVVAYYFIREYYWRPWCWCSKLTFQWSWSRRVNIFITIISILTIHRNGGSTTTTTGLSYDSVDTPSLPGSMGGGSGGKGGSVVWLSAPIVVVDGSINANGAACTPASCGGGSGTNNHNNYLIAY